ncbi:uncharacterized protein [Apostichopus japonicus]|uniref:uncharacterized protein isoform X5 n=1 Tax=Stichopus japonicus TaxID=307972 RepID=UPI003AB648BE
MAVVYSNPHSGTPLRSLEKVLEDAQMTGILNIGGRNMREYPQIAINYDLEDTTGADLSKNKLSELPTDLCGYLSLQNLSCYSNFIRAIPDEIVNLNNLTYLNLSRNQLSTLPVHICNLFLEVLIVSNNKLVSLPPEIGRMKTLMHLDASCNVLSTLPVDVGGLESLRELYVRRNQLVTVPEEISNLNLVKLDLSCNKITILPPSYRRIETLEELNVSQNPLENPPAQLCIRGKIHIFKFLSKKAMKDDKHRGLIDQQETNNWQRRPPFNHQRPNWLFIKPPSEGPPSLTVKSRTFPEITSEQNSLFYPPGSPPEKGSIASMADELAYVHDRMGELRRGMSGADSGYIEGDKRWSSSEASNEDEEARQLAERASQQKEHRQQRGDWQQKIIDSRSYQPSESITFIDAPATAAGIEERTSENEPTPVQSPTVTPRPTPITTPTSDVDPFTKVNTNTEELLRQKTNYEDQKRRAREERLRKEMEEAKSPQRVSPHRGEVSPRRGDLSPCRGDLAPHPVSHIQPHVNGVHSPSAAPPTVHMNGPVTTPNGSIPNGPTSVSTNGQVNNGQSVDPLRTPPNNPQNMPVISTTVVKEAVVVVNNNAANEANSKPLSERRRTDSSRTAVTKQANGTTNGALRSNSVAQRRTASTPSVSSDQTAKGNTTSNFNYGLHYQYSGKKVVRRGTVGVTPTDSTNKAKNSKLTQLRNQGRRATSTSSLRDPVQNGPTKSVPNGPVRKSSEGTIGGSAVSLERHEAQLARRKKEEEKQKVKQQQKDAVINYVKRTTKTGPPASTTGAPKSSIANERRNSGGRSSGRSSTASSASSNPSSSRNPPPPSQTYADSAFGSIKPRSAFSISTNKSATEKQSSNFTVKREMRQLKEEMDRIDQLKKSQQSNILSNVVSSEDVKSVQQMKKHIETKLKMKLSEDIPGELMNGVVLCHLINIVRPHAVSTIYLPAGSNKLTAAKCRRNVDNFVKSCQMAGVPKEKLCTSGDILEGKGLAKVALTIIALMQMHSSSRSSMNAS